ncbi:MAG: Y-family DNA polymerase, partial [Planctomycetota bacterium]
MKRVLSLYFPYLGTDRLRACAGGSVPDDAAAGAPLVVTATQASVVRVVVGDARAMRAGIGVGMTLAEARSLAPSLIAQKYDPDADRAALESLAIWADRFSPYVHLEGENTLLLDMTGSQRLFPDEEALLRRVTDGVVELGYTARAALADTPGAAWALSHASGADLIVAPSGRTAAAVAPLPVTALRIDGDAVAALRSLGVETIEALLHLPRSSLGSRFGEGLLYRLDQVLGEEPEVLTPFRAPPLLKSSLRIGRPTDRYDILREALERVLACFCEQLERRVAGVRQLFVTFYCPELRPITFELNVSRATRSAEHLRSLLVARLENLQLPAGASGVMLWARRVEPLDGWQGELFDTGRADAQGLAELIDRLANHLGAAAVVRPRPVSDHQPEHAFDYVPLVDCGLRVAERDSHFSLLTSHFPSRPLRLLPRPLEVSVIAVVPEGPPCCFDWKGE